MACELAGLDLGHACILKIASLRLAINGHGKARSKNPAVTAVMASLNSCHSVALCKVPNFNMPIYSIPAYTVADHGVMRLWAHRIGLFGPVTCCVVS